MIVWAHTQILTFAVLCSFDTRLEVCVLESFVYEAVVPFVQRKGLGWILPLHETWPWMRKSQKLLQDATKNILYIALVLYLQVICTILHNKNAQEKVI